MDRNRDGASGILGLDGVNTCTVIDFLSNTAKSVVRRIYAVRNKRYIHTGQITQDDFHCHLNGFC